MNRADRQPELVSDARVAHLTEKIASIKSQIANFNELNKQLQQTPDKQISLTDPDWIASSSMTGRVAGQDDCRVPPDARSMAMSGRGTGMVGYNVQTAVDTKHHLIVSHEVTNIGHDRSQLASMSAQAQEAVGKKDITVVADRGYYSGTEILACEELGVLPLVPKPLTSGNRAQGLFDRRDFVYDAARDEYRCPAGQVAPWRFTTFEHGIQLHKYWSSVCPSCPMKSQCTTGKNRRITRWEHEDVLDRMQQRLDVWPNPMRLRRQTVEHPFGTLKAWMGATHFLTKTLPRVKAEMSLHVLAYNLKRVMAILGIGGLMAAMKA